MRRTAWQSWIVPEAYIVEEYLAKNQIEDAL
jgi:hypothetical protein